MAVKSMGYDHPAYLARHAIWMGQNAAGASTVIGKFVAHANLIVYAVSASLQTVGTSLYTAWNGTATVTGTKGDSFNVVRITNTSTTTVPALATYIYGPYALSCYDGTAANTQTSTAGYANYVPMYQTGVAAPTSTGGFSVNQGDTLHILRGTDATAVSAYTLEYAIAPLANVAA